jgi:PBP1b-binding outer membrane lipoprotein LpoB
MKKTVLFAIMLGAAVMFTSCGSTEEVKTEEVATEAPAAEVTTVTEAPAAEAVVVDSTAAAAETAPVK